MAEEDVIYGKNRHFYGGIEPSNMQFFSAKYTRENDQNGVLLSYTLPTDTIVNESRLCSVAGAMIRKKANELPNDEFDGSLVVNVEEDGTFFDANVVEGVTYFYRAFPYTTQGVYCRNKTNSTSVITVQSGYIPGDITNFVVYTSFTGGSPMAILHIEGPSIIKEEGVVVDHVSDVVVRRSKTGYPLTEEDGDITIPIYSGTLDQTSSTPYDLYFHDETVEINKTYYYSAFPKSASGGYNRSSIGRGMITVSPGDPPKEIKYFKAYPTAILKKEVIILDVDMPDPPTSDPTIDIEVVIKKKVGAYPANINDGDLVATFDKNSKKTYNILNYDASDVGHYRAIDRNVEDGTTYYYRAFGRTSKGAVNEYETSTSKLTAKAVRVWNYGFRLHNTQDDSRSSNPDTAIDYDIPDTDFVIKNKNYSPMSVGRTTIGSNYISSVDWGSWVNMIPGTEFMPRPCLLNFDGTVRCYLNPKDFTKNEFGEPVTLDGTGDTLTADVMMEWPRTHYKISRSNPYTIVISNELEETHTEGRNFVYAQGSTFSKDDIAYIYTSVFPGSIKATSGVQMVRSIQTTTPKVYTSSDSFVNIVRSCAKTVVNGEYKEDTYRTLSCGQEYAYMTILLILMSKTTDLQDAFGDGRLYSTTQPADLGLKYGMFCVNPNTSNIDTTSYVRAFGMQDLWGGLGNIVFGYALTANKKDKTYPWYYVQSFYHQDQTNSWTDWMYSSAYYEIRSVGSSGNEMIFPTPSTSEVGNGYISYLVDTFYFGMFFPNLSKVTKNVTVGNSTWVMESFLTGSSSTYMCDYAQVVDYPSTSNFTIPDSWSGDTGVYSTPVMAQIGSSKENTTTADAKGGRMGPMYVYFCNSMQGANARFSYIRLAKDGE